jgi:hypothetical protein
MGVPKKRKATSFEVAGVIPDTAGKGGIFLAA